MVLFERIHFVYISHSWNTGILTGKLSHAEKHTPYMVKYAAIGLLPPSPTYWWGVVDRKGMWREVPL